ncbi:MAG: DegV family protein [Anaerolineaceae bacterium]|nr:DegV family protein [Anaerolineaceae bacterium]
MNVKIVTDSSCDLPQTVLEKYDISVVPLYINFPDQSLLDGVEISRKAFYERLPQTVPPPTTSAPAIGSFAKKYQELIEKGAEAVLSIHISSVLSGTVNVASLAAESLQNAMVKTFDAGQLSIGTGLVVEAAAKAAAAGKNLDEILEEVKSLASRTYTFAAVDTLKYLQRSGRISHLTSSLGSLLQIKPILQMSQGKVKMGISRTINGSVKQLLSILKELGAVEQLNLVHSNAPERAQMLYETAKEYFPQGKEPFIVDITPVLGAHVGPGIFGFVAVKQE